MNTTLHAHESSPQELDEETSRTANIRFKQQLFSNVGGGMIFALVGVVTTLLLHNGAGGLLASTLGIGAVAAIGLGCIFMAAKYLSTAVALDQDAQARKICKAGLGKAPVLDPTLAPAVTQSVPGISDQAAQTINANDNQPDNHVSNIAYQQKLAQQQLTAERA